MAFTLLCKPVFSPIAHFSNNAEVFPHLGWHSITSDDAENQRLGFRVPMFANIHNAFHLKDILTWKLKKNKNYSELYALHLD